MPFGTGVISPRNTYKDLLPAVVWVGRANSTRGTGTGCLVDRKHRLVLTAFHLVGNDEKVQVWFPAFEDGKLLTQRESYTKAKAIPARVVLKEPRCDLAVLELDSLPDGMSELKLTSASAAPGERLFSMGNPTKSSALWRFQPGEVRQIYARDARPQREWNARVLEIQSPYNQGDDGGPVVNARGELIGIVQAAAPKAPYVTGCLEVTEIRDVLKTLTKD